MKVSVNWLRDYVDLQLPVNELAEQISRTSVEIEGQYQPQGKMKKIVIAKVLSVVPHPDSDHLVITQIDAGQVEPIQIVTGAPNVATGQTVILAKHGAVIGNGVKIKKGKLRGEVSNGMLCALQEIGMDDAIVPQPLEDGIWVFDEEDAKALTPGEDALHVLGLDDDILETGITPNRADMLSMNGTAYEVAAMLDQPVKMPTFTLNEAQALTQDTLTVKADARMAATYAARVIQKVRVKNSPLWLQRRLWNMGIKPVNNVIDAVNYTLLTYGEALHAYDLQSLPAAELHVQMASGDEILVTEDGVSHTAHPGDLLVMSGQEPVMFAGIMGTAKTQVTKATQDVVLEAGIFEAKTVRRTARDQNLHTESSQRLERGVDVDQTLVALDYAAALIAELGQGQVLQDAVVAQVQKLDLPVVTLHLSHLQAVLGSEITTQEVAHIFEQLQFDYEQQGDAFVVTVPSRRWDISIEADLVEEIARIYGYDRLPATLPVGATTPGKLNAKQQLIRASRHILEGLGLNQAMSYVLTTPEKAQNFKIHLDQAGEPIQLAYPMSQDRQQTRSSLLTGLLDDVAYNVARKQNDVALYEQGRVFSVQPGAVQPIEKEHLAGVMTGAWQTRNWSQTAQDVDFYTVKGLVEQLLTNYNFVDSVRFMATNQRLEMHPGQTADIYVGETLIGMVGQIHPITAKAYKVGKVFGFELDLQAIMDLPKVTDQYEAISRYPAISRDLAILVDAAVTAETLRQALVKAGGKYLKQIDIFDVYTGEHVPGGKKSLAYTLTFVNREQTLTDEIVNTAMDRIETVLRDEFAAEIR